MMTFEDSSMFLKFKLREAYEAWAGSVLPDEPEAETAPEAYAYRIIKEMLEPIKEALAVVERDELKERFQ